MAEAVVTETTAEAPDPDPEQGCKTRVKKCLLSVWNRVWNSLPGKIVLYVLLPLVLYLADIITDLILVVQYHNSGDCNWFRWTLVFVLVPTLMINITYFKRYFRKDNKLSNYIRSLLSTLQLSVFLEYFDLLRLLLKGKDVKKRVEGDLAMIHLLEVLESVPQLCLQLYIIIITGEQVSVLKVITMVASLLAAVKAVVTKFYYSINEADRTCSCGFVTWLILLNVWKVVELSVRVLAIVLFASAVEEWFVLPIGIQWLIMTSTLLLIDGDYRRWPYMIAAPLQMAVDTFSMTASMDHNRLFWLSAVLTLLGNITMVTVWYTLKAGQDWYDVPALVGVLVGSVVSAGLGFMVFMIRDRDRIKSQLESLIALQVLLMINEQDSSAPDSGTYMEFETNV